VSRKTVTAVVAAVVALWLSAAPASADLELATSHGSGAGQTEKPRAIAVDRSSGNVYVADTGNNRVDVFEADGDFVRAFGWGVADGTTNALQACTTTCFKGITGSGAGQFSAADLGRDSIAVDNDPTSPTFHQVFVGSSRVQRFSPTGGFLATFSTSISGRMTVGPDGDVYVANTPNHLVRSSSSGDLLTEFTLPPAGLGGLNGITVDSTGSFYLASAGETGAVRKYDPTGALLNTLNLSFNIQVLATDAADSLFVSDVTGVDHVAHYAAAGTQLRVIYGDRERRLISLAPYSNGTGDVFGLEDVEGDGALSRTAHIPFPPPGPIVLPFSGSLDATGTTATAISNTKATINAQINPEGKATTFRVEYVDEETYEDEGFATPLKTTEIAVGSDFALHNVSTPIGCPNPAIEVGKPGSKCLLPETTYHYRAVATNADGSSTGPEGEPFTTKPSLEITATFTTDVVTDSAVLHAEVNPLGIPATGYFQYVDEETCQEDLKALGPDHCFDHATDIPTPAEPIDFGSGEAPKAAVAHLTSLTPATTYRYRLLATNAFTTQTGAEQALHTYAPPSEPKTDCPNQAFRTAASAALPDCRAYELVSPTDKAGGDIAPLLDANLEQGARDGESITYSSYRAFAGPASAPFTSQYLARRTDAGWQSESMAPPREGASFYGGEYRTANQYKLFSEDLCSAWLTTETEPLLAPKALVGFPNLYRRQNCAAPAAYEALTTALPKDADPTQLDPKPQAFSADGTLSVFTAEGRLTPDGVLCSKAKGPFCTRQAYLSRAGKLRLLCILPDGTPSGNDCAVGFIRAPDGTVGQRSDDAYHAVSENGSRIFWTNSFKSGPLYVRINPDQGQSKVVDGKCTEAAKACTLAVSVTNAHFRTAAADGSAVIYTEGEFDGALHEFDVDAALAEEPEVDTEIAGNALSVLGASENASRVFFVSPEVLSKEPNSEGDKAVAGQPNLYLREASKGGGVGSFAFIGVLSDGDAVARNQSSPGMRESRVNPDGAHLAFVSAAPLTGYDNTDASSGKADKEVFLYDAEEGKLRCISCNPSGGRPVGLNLPVVVPEEWTAARIPAWTNGVRFSGILSDDGDGLFFESIDPLVLRDTNGAIDVYEWSRADEKEECDQIGADLFSPRASGCISLVSPGKSPQHSQLVDASTDGEDVFFMTQSSLLPQDTGLIDIYDARVDGGFPQSSPPPANCEGEACQGTPAAPNDPTPASSAFEGAGNLIGGAKPRSCRKGKVRRKGRCVTKLRKRPAKRSHRANHDREAGR
jgi:NHL repeat